MQTIKCDQSKPNNLPMQNGAHHKINANVTQNKVKENGLANNMRNITSEY